MAPDTALTSPLMRVGVLVAVCVLGAAVAFQERYKVVSVNSGRALWVVNDITGNVRFCHVADAGQWYGRVVCVSEKQP